jgi:hypothetical protein
VPKASKGRSSAPQASHSTAKTELKRASHSGQRDRISPAHCGHVAGNSRSDSSKYRCANPQLRQNETQSPRVLRRSSRSQSDALPTSISLDWPRARAPWRSRALPGGSLDRAGQRGSLKEGAHGGTMGSPVLNPVAERLATLFAKPVGRLPHGSRSLLSTCRRHEKLTTWLRRSPGELSRAPLSSSVA